MKKHHFIFSALFILISFLSTLSVFAQKKGQSPRDSVNGRIGKATISINYGSPSVKGRKIWGDLVPYGKVWRTGANEATTFKTDQDIMVEGKKLPAGKYAFFAIPGEKTWIIIFNKTANQWGSFSYKEGDDALRVEVKPGKSAAMNEHLVYKVSNSGVSLLWENLEVPVSVR